jgi:hypothetical protein
MLHGQRNSKPGNETQFLLYIDPCLLANWLEDCRHKTKYQSRCTRCDPLPSIVFPARWRGLNKFNVVHVDFYMRASFYLYSKRKRESSAIASPSQVASQSRKEYSCYYHTNQFFFLLLSFSNIQIYIRELSLSLCVCVCFVCQEAVEYTNKIKEILSSGEAAT